MQIYVDESGDLGWTFSSPYGNGGSSRYLTIAAMFVPDDQDHLPRRKIRDLYKSGKWDQGREKKWVEMAKEARLTFATNAINLKNKNSDIAFKAIVVNKQNVNDNFRSDANKLYNYMLKLLLLEDMCKYESVTLIPDPRSIKVHNGACLHHYLEMMLYEKQAKTKLESVNRDSKECLNLQFVDMLAGVVGTHYEFSKSECWNILSKTIQLKTLFF